MSDEIILKEIEFLSERAEIETKERFVYKVCKRCGEINPPEKYHEKPDDFSWFDDYGWRCGNCGGKLREVYVDGYANKRWITNSVAIEELKDILDSLPKPILISEKEDEKIWKIGDATVKYEEWKFYDDLTGGYSKMYSYTCSKHGRKKCTHILALLWNTNPVRLLDYGLPLLV